MSVTGHSRADYSPQNLAKSMEFFHYILNGRIAGGRTFGLCDMTFIYDTVRGLPHGLEEPHLRVIARRHPACPQPAQPPQQPLRKLRLPQRKVTKYIKHL